MFLAFAFLLFIILSRPAPAAAQIPLFYQLLSAYYPSSFSSGLPQIFTPPSVISPTPSPAAPSVLGLTTQSTLPPALPVGVGGGDGKIITVAVLGDSMIDTLGPDIPKLEEALRRYYPTKKFRIINYGVGASNIEYALFRLTNDYEYAGKHFPSLISHRPDLVVIESFAYNNFGNTQDGFNRQWTALDKITATLKDKLPQTKILLAAAIAPNSLVFANGIPDLHYTSLEKIERTKTIKLYLQNLIKYATDNNFPLADAYHPSLINNEGKRDYISPKDNLHPSIEGGQFMTATIAKAINDNRLVPSLTN